MQKFLFQNFLSKLAFCCLSLLFFSLQFSCSQNKDNNYQASAKKIQERQQFLDAITLNYAQLTDSQKRQLLQQGSRLYHVRGCVRCHGLDGGGKGSMSYSLGKNNQPRNFRNLSAYLQGSDIDAIARTIKVSITNKKSVMPSYPFLNDNELYGLASLVVQFQQQQQQKKTSLSNQ